MLYLAVIALTLFLLPLGSVAIEHVVAPSASLMILVGKWFVFWGVGVRLGLAGLRQFFQPGFTAREIFRIESDAVLPLVQELGVANFATAVVALWSLVRPDFVLPVAITAGIFYGVAGVRHVIERPQTLNQAMAMVTDLYMFAVLAIVVGTAVFL